MSNSVKTRNRRTYPLSRRVLGNKLRILSFQLVQLAKQSIVLTIRDRRLVKHVVPIVCLLELVAQLEDSLVG